MGGSVVGIIGRKNVTANRVFQPRGCFEGDTSSWSVGLFEERFGACGGFASWTNQQHSKPERNVFGQDP
jgi:hypothetical protein